MNKKIVLLSFLTLFFVLPAVMYASSHYPIDFAAILQRIIDILWIIFWGIIITAFIIIGILYLTAQGDPGKVSKLNKAVIWGVIGVAVGILAFSAYRIVYNLIFGGY